jgi:nitrite reductase (cytochrome c-552)
MLLFAVGLSACTDDNGNGIVDTILNGNGNEVVVLPETPEQPPHHGIGVRVITADEWFDAHPQVVASYRLNEEVKGQEPKKDYLELYPHKRVLFEGFGFAINYFSPRAHGFSMNVTDTTHRPTFRANCFACKSANYPAISAAMGIEFYSMPYTLDPNHPAFTPFELDPDARPFSTGNPAMAAFTPGHPLYGSRETLDMRSLMPLPVSCFNCHGNEPGELRITHAYLDYAIGHMVGIGPGLIHPASASCAQCHIEYHFHPETWHVVVPFTNIAEMCPTAMREYFNNFISPDGLPFADYINPRTGVRQIMIQHPELETVYGEGNWHSQASEQINHLGPEVLHGIPMNEIAAFSCADCHMDQEAYDPVASVFYISHFIDSPLTNLATFQRSCFSCHGDHDEFVAEIRAIQAEYTARRIVLGDNLAEIMERLYEAVSSGNHTEAQLDEIRENFRSAQIYWNFFVAENSNGAHNSWLAFDVARRSQDIIDIMDVQLRQLGH